MNIPTYFKNILVICGSIGLVASFLLTISTMELAENPNTILPCNINPFISCTNAIVSEQGEIFGFPNPLIGIVGFTIIITIGSLSLFGATFNKNLWKIFTIGMSFVAVLIHWFIYESLFVLGSLCIYCMITWAVVWPIFLYTLVAYIKDLRENFITKNHLALLIGWYLLVVLLILIKFKEYFLS